MTNETSSQPRPELRWTTPGAAPGLPPANNSLSRFLGGSPGAVFIRLFFVSLIVGALLMWLDIRPWDIFRAIDRLVNRLWALGFDAVREIGTYVLAGAALVIPIWLVMRLMNFRGAR